MKLSSFEEIIQFAIKREEEAGRTYGEMAEMSKGAGLKKLLQELYSDLAQRSEGKEQRKLFSFLEMQEKSHKLKLETEYEKHVLSED